LRFAYLFFDKMDKSGFIRCIFDVCQAGINFCIPFFSSKPQLF